MGKVLSSLCGNILVCCVNGFQGFTGNLLGHSDLETQYVIFEEPSKKSSEDVNKSCSMFRESLKPNLILSGVSCLLLAVMATI